MASSEIEKTGIAFRVLASLSPVSWNKLSFWGKAEDVELDNGQTVQQVLETFTGITSDITVNDKTLGASSYLMNTLNGEAAIYRLDRNGWSSTYTYINGIAYRSQEFAVSDILLEYPLMYLVSATIPTETINDVWGEIQMVADKENMKIIFYVQNVPSATIDVGVKGVVKQVMRGRSLEIIEEEPINVGVYGQ